MEAWRENLIEATTRWIQERFSGVSNLEWDEHTKKKLHNIVTTALNFLQSLRFQDSNFHVCMWLPAKDGFSNQLFVEDMTGEDEDTLEGRCIEASISPMIMKLVGHMDENGVSEYVRAILAISRSN